MFEFGFLSALETKLPEALINSAKKDEKLDVFENLDELFDEVSKNFSPDVKLDKIENLFLYFGSFLVLVFLVFFGETFLRRRLRAIKRKLVHFSRRNHFRRFSIYNLGQSKI